MFISVDLPAPFSPSSACTSPRRTSRETSSLATTPGNSLRMPRISRTRSSLTAAMLLRNRRRTGNSPALRGSSLLSERRRWDEPAGDHVRLVLVHRRDPRLRHLRADLAHADAAVLQVEQDVAATLERALRHRGHHVVDADIGLLQRAREDVLRDAVLVRVDAYPPLAR